MKPMEMRFPHFTSLLAHHLNKKKPDYYYWFDITVEERPDGSYIIVLLPQTKEEYDKEEGDEA